MAEFDRRFATAQNRTDAGVADYDAGLRAFMLSVYNYMAVGVALTGAAAYGLYTYAMSSEAVFNAVFRGPMSLVLTLAPLGYGLYLIFRMNSMSTAGARNGFFIYAALVGLMLSTIFVMYSHQSIARVFFISSGMFAATSLYGYTTKRDLTGMGSFLMMGLFGLIIAMVVNMFFPSGPMQFAISVIGVLIYTGLAAYDTQKLKDVYLAHAGDEATLGHSAVRGALSLYLDFINLFLFMLRLMGDRRS